MSRGYLLFAEPDPDLATLYNAFFTSVGYEAEIVFTGAELLKKVESGLPDAVVLEVDLPDMSGYEVGVRLHRFDSELIFIFIARWDKYNGVRGLEVGAYYYLKKPFDLEELRRRLYVALQLKRE